jgi:hypothetical protein
MLRFKFVRYFTTRQEINMITIVGNEMRVRATHGHLTSLDKHSTSSSYRGSGYFGSSTKKSILDPIADSGLGLVFAS